MFYYSNGGIKYQGMEKEICLQFDPTETGKLFRPEGESKNGIVTIIGGSELFHGAPLLSLTTASKIVDIVFFSSPDPSVGEVANILKSRLSSFIWVPWDEIGEYIKKSDAILIGPGLMRYHRENQKTKSKNEKFEDETTRFTKGVTERLLLGYPDKRWVIDAGSLQVMKPEWIPHGSILTPNKKEYSMLFGDEDPGKMSEKYDCTIIVKGVVDKVYSSGRCVAISGGNAGMSKGGTGDTLAGLIVALFAKNDAILSASCSSYIVKKTGDRLFKKVGTNFNADDLAVKVPEILGELQN